MFGNTLRKRDKRLWVAHEQKCRPESQCRKVHHYVTLCESHLWNHKCWQSLPSNL